MGTKRRRKGEEKTGTVKKREDGHGMPCPYTEIVATTCAAMASPRPIASTPSFVFAFK